MKKRELRHGYTTGACAAAAARGAALMLRDQAMVEQVEITLPRGETVRFRLHGQAFDRDAATCYVVKDAGDDPDVTNGAEIHARVSLREGAPGSPVIIEGGPGVGRVTKPGLAVPVGEWAINPVPRKMITEAVLEVFTHHPSHITHHASALEPRPSNLVPHVVISIPNGEELAKKTLNARLGIVGGLSILGTTGIVKPISAQAWTDTIDAAIDVALACGSPALVLSTGRTSELAAQRYLSAPDASSTPLAARVTDEATSPSPIAHRPLPEESFVMMGDHAGHALRSCGRKGVKEVVLAGQFAKLLKIACGHEQTHVSSSQLDLRTLAEWLAASPGTSRLAPRALKSNTARELFEATNGDPELVSLVCGRAARFAAELADGCRVKVFLAGYGGEMLYFG